MPTPAVSQAPTADQTKTERVYNDLRRRIRELTLPPGEPLRRDEIALELGVSRAPVSEAIARLADEALVDVFPQHGSFVAPIRASDVREALFIRTGLEVEAIRRAALTRDAGLLARLDANLDAQAEALKAGDLALFYDLDDAMHAAIFATLGMARAERLLEAARAPLDRPRRILLPEDGRPEATLVEHRRLVDAIRSGDVEFAAAAMRVHLSMVSAIIERTLTEIEAGAPQPTRPRR